MTTIDFEADPDRGYELLDRELTRKKLWRAGPSHPVVTLDFVSEEHDDAPAPDDFEQLAHSLAFDGSLGQRDAQWIVDEQSPRTASGRPHERRKIVRF